MKLFCPLYISPNPLQGEFKNVTIQEVCITHKEKQKFLEIQFDTFYQRDGREITITTQKMQFQGMEGDEKSTNQTTWIRVNNPEYDPEINYQVEEPNPDWVEGSENIDVEGNPIPETIMVNTTPPEKIIIPLFNKQWELNVSSMDFEILDYGWPTYEKAIKMFQGGNFEHPEILITDPLAIGFVLNKLIINGEPIGKQFQLVL